MRKVVCANSKCPLCGCGAYASFMNVECTNMACSNWKAGVVTKAEYAFMESKKEDEDKDDEDADWGDRSQQNIFDWYKDQHKEYQEDDAEDDESKD
jgi:hypothetical protein